MVGCVFPCRKRISGRGWTDDVHLGGGTIGGGVPQKWGTDGLLRIGCRCRRVETFAGGKILVDLVDVDAASKFSVFLLLF